MRIAVDLLLESQLAEFRLCKLPGIVSGEEGSCSRKDEFLRELELLQSKFT